MFGICLGHQLLCRAVGLETFKLPFGHRGANHPVKDLATGRIEITSQNHGFAVRGPGGEHRIEGDEPVRWETDFGAAELSHLNLYDRTVEGLVLRTSRARRSSTTPRPGPGPTTPATSSTASWSSPQPMPRRDDIQKILLIGSGPIVIGQAAEFDYSGVQACKVLLDEGYEVVLVNSNPATIMTDPEFADRTYVEPLTARVGRRGSSSASAPTRCCRRSAARRRSTSPRRCTTTASLERFGVELIGADYEAIHRAEDREVFRETMEGAGLRVPWSLIVDRGRRRRAGARRRRARAARDRQAGVHARRRRAAGWGGPRPSCARSSRRGSPRARSTRCWSRSRCSAGASSSSS